MNIKQPTYVFVLPRFGKGIVGGAEHLAGSLARKLRDQGAHVEVLTTCARDNRTWENYFDAGDSIEEGLIIRRFPVESRDLDTWIPLQIKISEGMKLSLEEQLEWMTHSVNSFALYEYIQRHAHTFDALFFAPYLFGTTFWGALIAPQRSVLIPCLHDEHYAYTDVIRALFREVGCALFNCEPERELAEQLYGTIVGGSVGMGFEPEPCESLPEILPFFQEDFPYLLYVGRKETGKGAHELIDKFIAAKQECLIDEHLKLVIVGGGSFSDLHRPEALERNDVIDLAPVTEEEKRSLLRFATALVQPSRNESFSIVLMESWMVETPVIVHAGCPVTKHHCVAAGGGLYYASLSDFAAVVSELATNASLRNQLGIAGRSYVEKAYSWDAVLERFHRVMEEIFVMRHRGQQQDGVIYGSTES
jgi:glycosyltransferase involved in cell wall biosynthesis